MSSFQVPRLFPSLFYVHIKREGYDEERYKEVGRTYSVNDTQTIQCAIINKSICWYGDVNFLGYHAADNTVMRIADAKMAGELLDVIEDLHTSSKNKKTKRGFAES